MDRLCFDIESTGPDTQKDRIVELAILIENDEEGIILNKAKRYNPTIPISQAATDIHGITDKDVKDCPLFSDDAKKLKKIFEDKIIITFNGQKFDIPLLMAEFERAGVEINFSGKFVDCLLIERKFNTNTLADTYKRYTGKSLENAHNALADLAATIAVFNYQSEKLINIRETSDQDWEKEDIMEDLYEMSGTKNIVDVTGKFKMDDEGYLIFNFGNKLGRRLVQETNYCSWMLKENFPASVKKLITKELSRIKESAFGIPKGPIPKKGGFEPTDDLPF